MKYQDCIEALQASEEAEAAHEARLIAANINPATGLASDYLNHFNEAIMLLELMSSCPDCRDDFLAWQPMSYRQHFEASHFKGRELAIAAYDAADSNLRGCLDTLAGTMTAVLEATRAAMSADLPPERITALAEHAATWLRPLVARTGAVINGKAGIALPEAPQAVVDGLMKR
ncbi:MAG: hypothetical protein HY244_16620 [Rhizobiales bacterium]|nr:hypothetical protein [Hyphomicrobiales bacterium]